MSVIDEQLSIGWRWLADERRIVCALLVDAEGIKADYLEEVAAFQGAYKKECRSAQIDYIPLHTGMPFDKALMSYLLSRQGRG